MTARFPGRAGSVSKSMWIGPLDGIGTASASRARPPQPSSSPGKTATHALGRTRVVTINYLGQKAKQAGDLTAGCSSSRRRRPAPVNDLFSGKHPDSGIRNGVPHHLVSWPQ